MDFEKKFNQHWLKHRAFILWISAFGVLSFIVYFFFKPSLTQPSSVDYQATDHARTHIEYSQAKQNNIQRRASTVAMNEHWQMLDSQPSSNKNITLNIYVRNTPLPVNTIQQWRIEILDVHSKPIDVEKVEIDGGMQAHGHGLPTQAKITHHIKQGNYIVDGIKFNMSGDWQMRFSVLYQGQWHKLDFNLTIQPFIKKVNHKTWNDSEIAILNSLSLSSLPTLKKDTTNNVSKNKQASQFGRALFFDKSLSHDGSLSCASCHQPNTAFQDGLKTAQGMKKLHRNTPSLIGIAHHDWFYWDGRRDSLWSQALTPFEASQEMASNRLAVIKKIIANTNHKKQYEKIFGKLPILSPATQKLLSASPLGDENEQKNWKTIPVRERRNINKVLANLGKAIAAFEETLNYQPSKFDNYVSELVQGKNSDILNTQEIAGLKLFISGKTQCMKCHNSPLFSNKEFHNIGTINTLPSGLLDVGRLSGVQIALLDEFNCRGRYSDAKDKTCKKLEYINTHEILDMQQGAFKVPSLRNLILTSPYMHDGAYNTLHEVIEHYRQPPTGVGNHELQPLINFSDNDADNLVAFLKTLTSHSPKKQLDAKPK